MLTRRVDDRKDHEPSEPSPLTCVALATGMKCLPQSKLPLAKGNVLHDWHAEVLAIRGFNRWLVDECEELARGGFKQGEEGESAWIRWREEGRSQAARIGDAEVRGLCACSVTRAGEVMLTA